MITIYLSTGKELEVMDAEYHELFEHFMDASLPDELTTPCGPESTVTLFL